MSHAEKFLQFVRQRTEPQTSEAEFYLRIETGQIVVTQRWITKAKLPAGELLQPDARARERQLGPAMLR